MTDPASARFGRRTLFRGAAAAAFLLTPAACATGGGDNQGTAGTKSATNPFGAAEQNGALYVGIDGTGLFNQSGGTVTAQGLVLDNPAGEASRG